MKKITKALFIFILSLIMCMTSIPASANNSDGITPYYACVNDVVFAFSATSSGGYAEARYYGADNFFKAKITIKVEKRFLLAFWNDVGEWSSESTEKNGLLGHIFELNGSGTYRATFSLTIMSDDGYVDTITETIESKY